MENSSGWIWEEVKRYQQDTGNIVNFPSDWDTELDNISYPHQIIKDAINKSSTGSNFYLYSEDQYQIKDIILKALLKNGDLNFSIKHIALCTNSTSSLYTALAALNKFKIKRFLVVTPVYYSILDTLKDFDLTPIFYHLLDHDDFKFDISKLKAIMEQQYVEAIILTDPIYSTGIAINIEQFNAILSLCQQKGIWVIIDNTLSGMPWDHSPAIFDREKLKIVSQCAQYIFIDSLTKRFQINSIKHSLILATPEVGALIEDLSCQISGGFCTTQLELIKELYHEENEQQLMKILTENIRRLKQNHALLKAALIGTDFSIYSSNNGYFTIIHHNSLRMSEVNIKDIVKRFIHHQQIRIIPLSSLSFYHDVKFGFRLNLLKDIRPMIPLLLEGIRENIY